MQYFNNSQLEVTDLFAVSSEMVMLSYREKSKLCAIQKHQNIVIAAFATAHARLHLYNVMEKLDASHILYTGKNKTS